MPADSAGEPVPERLRDERYGIVAVARMRKDDGRSLTLYSRVDGADRDDDVRDARPAAAPAGDDERA